MTPLENFCTALNLLKRGISSPPFSTLDLGRDTLVTGKQVVEIKHTLKEPRSLTDPVRTAGHTMELRLRDISWSQANGEWASQTSDSIESPRVTHLSHRPQRDVRYCPSHTMHFFTVAPAEITFVVLGVTNLTCLLN